MYKDGSVPQSEVCVVRFEPTADSKAPIKKVASGEIERDGSFEMHTRKFGDGVFLGSYVVTFSVWKDRETPESLIAEKYTKATTTPYTIQVSKDVDNLVYELEPAEPQTEQEMESSAVESTEQENESPAPAVEEGQTQATPEAA